MAGPPRRATRTGRGSAGRPAPPGPGRWAGTPRSAGHGSRRTAAAPTRCGARPGLPRPARRPPRARRPPPARRSARGRTAPRRRRPRCAARRPASGMRITSPAWGARPLHEQLSAPWRAARSWPAAACHRRALMGATGYPAAASSAAGSTTCARGQDAETGVQVGPGGGGARHGHVVGVAGGQGGRQPLAAQQRPGSVRGRCVRSR